MSAAEDIRESVRRRYAAAATRSAAGDHEGALVVETSCCGPAPVATAKDGTAASETSCCGPASVATTDERGRVVFGAELYGPEAQGAPAEAGVANVEFLKGYLEDIPLPEASVDVVISNCVINLAADKNVVLAEAARVLRPGGRLAFSDVLADEDMDEATKADMSEWTGCIAGALTQAEFTGALTAAGFTDIQISPTHRVHAHAQAALIRASAGPLEAKGTAMTPVDLKGTAMTVEVFEPALCCATGVCGEDVDQSLVTFSADLDYVRGSGGNVRRYNLASEPLAFAESEAVRGFLQVVGSKGLPLVLVNGVTAMTGGYPDRARLAEWAGVVAPAEAGSAAAPAGATMLGLTAAAPTSSGCCSSPDAETSDACCSSSAADTSSGCCSSSAAGTPGCC